MERDQRYVALDTETTGIEPSEGHRVVEIGAVEFRNGMVTGVDWHSHLDPECNVPSEAVAVHGLTREFLSGKPKFAAVAKDFLTFCSDAVIVIHNAPFDLSFLDAELRRAGLTAFTGCFKVTDSLVEARKRYPRKPNDLNSLCNRLGVDIGDRALHGALKDARLLAAAYMRMCDADGLAHAFASTAATAPITVPGAPAARDAGLLVPRARLGVGGASPDEIERHETFIATLTAPIWHHPN